MGYASQSLVESILANALTRGTSDGMPVEIINIGNSLRDTVGSSTLIQYIRWADEEIDAALSVIYKVPLKRIVRGEFEILSDISAGNDIIYIEDSSRFFEGDPIVVTDRIASEKKIVSSIIDENQIQVSSVFVNSFSFSNSNVQRLGFPDPVPLISARFAAANLYDKKFAAQVSPNVSQYGSTLRSMGENDLNSVLNGRIRLMGQKWLGRRFFNPALLDVNAISSREKNRDQAQS